jgi:hypothetical protein
MAVYSRGVAYRSHFGVLVIDLVIDLFFLQHSLIPHYNPYTWTKFTPSLHVLGFIFLLVLLVLLFSQCISDTRKISIDH